MRSKASVLADEQFERRLREIENVGVTSHQESKWWIEIMNEFMR